MTDFAVTHIDRWPALLDLRHQFGSDWIFRGQSSDWTLKTTLDRVLGAYDLQHKLAPSIEMQMIRDFRRRYSNADQTLIGGDSLYCLALIQHHGGPTRLLDFTYSFFVASFFALDALTLPEGQAVIWCIRKGWTLKESRLKIPNIDDRNIDAKRNEKSFQKCYVNSKQTFVFHENPLHLNTRLIIQQGGFLCPGDIRKGFEENLKDLNGWDNSRNVLKINVELSASLRRESMQELLRMNVSRATLFPGNDGVAASFSQRLPLLAALAERNGGRKHS